ncbi:hypothetical protein D039_3529B, partial [Vibrio parahaemolyticus EKP-028]
GESDSSSHRGRTPL